MNIDEFIFISYFDMVVISGFILTNYSQMVVIINMVYISLELIMKYIIAAMVD